MNDLKNIIEKIVPEEDKSLIDNILEVVTKITTMPNGTKTNIAKLIDYNPQNGIVGPLTQGKVSYYVRTVCKEINIKLEESCNEIGGLAFFDEFTKI